MVAVIINDPIINALWNLGSKGNFTVEDIQEAVKHSRIPQSTVYHRIETYRKGGIVQTTNTNRRNMVLKLNKVAFQNEIGRVVE